MITRIKIDGFKSLLNTELYFDTFTCIAGVNAIGKSNFFDALMFLSKLADHTIVDAAKSIRSENQKHSEIKDIFYKNGNDYYSKMSFEVDMLVARSAEDDLGQMAEASITSLRYVLELQLNQENSNRELIEIIKEELKPIPRTEARKNIHFNPSTEWVRSVIYGQKTTSFISTENNKVRLHQDGGGGRTTLFIAEKMPRTLLSTVTAESPTAFMVRHEMRNWLMLQLEPSALREPNSIYEVKNAEMTAYGNNLPATLYRLHLAEKEGSVYQRLTNQMKELVPSVDEIMIDNDEKRNLLTLQIRFKDGLVLPAQSLSDGTLRFLGLAILKEDNRSGNLICLEEPENGIHPKKIVEIVNLLKAMASDVEDIMDDSDPLRQVIINSHSPLVVSSVPEDSLYLASDTEEYSDFFKRKIRYTSFYALSGTWRVKNKLCEAIHLGAIMDYLSSEAKGDELGSTQGTIRNKGERTVKENASNQLALF